MLCNCTHSKDLFLFTYVCVYPREFICTTCMQVPVEAREHEIPLELELQAVMSHLIWVLGTIPWSSARKVSTLTTDPALRPVIIHISLYAFKNVLLERGFLRCSRVPWCRTGEPL